jgi:hypothetical protein
MRLLPKITQRTATDRRTQVYRGILRQQAKMGGQLFGPIPEGHRREFFCLDSHTWVWHEEWFDQEGKHRAVTTRYDIRPQGILKSQGSNSYQLVTGEELRNLYRAARMYRDSLHAQKATYAAV